MDQATKIKTFYRLAHFCNMSYLHLNILAAYRPFGSQLLASGMTNPICRTRGHLSDKGTFLSDKGTFLSDKGTFLLKSVFGLLWAGGGRWKCGTTF